MDNIDRFNVGDIVSVYPSSKKKGVVVDIQDDIPVVFWFDIEDVEEYNIFRHCEGLYNSNYCESCDYQVNCEYFPHIVHCNVSEFSELLEKGKVNRQTCIDRRCKYKYFCLTRYLVKGSVETYD